MRWMLLIALPLLAGCSHPAETVKLEGRWHLVPPEEELNESYPDKRQVVLLRGRLTEDKTDKEWSLPARNEFLITNRESWESIWKSADLPTPKVNFKTHMILAVCRTITGEGTQAFHIDRIEKQPGGYVVYVKTQILPPGSARPTVVYGEEADYALIRKTELPFIFAEDPFWIMPE